jgi:hypothetical protein
VAVVEPNNAAGADVHDVGRTRDDVHVHEDVEGDVVRGAENEEPEVEVDVGVENAEEGVVADVACAMVVEVVDANVARTYDSDNARSGAHTREQEQAQMKTQAEVPLPVPTLPDYQHSSRAVQ